MPSGRHKSNLKRIQAKLKAKQWRKDDNWKSIQGGFNPDVFDDLDSDTRKRLLEHKIGPRVLMGDDKLIGPRHIDAQSALEINQWSDGEIRGLGYTSYLSDDQKAHVTNRGYVQDAAWEMGLSGIETKEDLNRFLERTEALKAEHGDFDWGPEATMLFRNQPATTEEPIETPTPEPEHEPSQELIDTRDQWDSRGTGGSIHYNPTSGGTRPGMVDGVAAAAQYANDASDDYHNRFIPHLNLQANLEALEMGDAGSRHLNRFEGKVPELASDDIKSLYDYYSKKITA